MAIPPKNINLLIKQELKKSSFDKILNWALTVGRHILIVTLSISILTFGYRFKLDSDLAKINEQIKQKQDTIASLQELETNIRFIQKRLNLIKTIETNRPDFNIILSELSKITPLDLTFNELTINQKSITAKGICLSKNGLSTFLNGLKINPKFTDISLDTISSKGEQDPTLQFSLSANIKK